MNKRSGVLVFALAVPCTAAAAAAPAAATYAVSWPGGSHVRLHVTTQLPAGDGVLAMAQSWPGDAEPVASGGWPALVRNLSVRDGRGDACVAVAKGSDGWQLPSTCSGAVTLAYDVDYTILQRSHWPAHREAAFRDTDAVSIIGRSLFITRGATQPARVSFRVPHGWHVATPWRADGGTAFSVQTTDDLVDNLIAFSRHPLRRMFVNGFEVSVLSFGPWRSREAIVEDTLRAAIRRYTTSMPVPRPQPYLVVLHPQDDTGGESFRASFAMNASVTGGPKRPAEWQGRLAHEIFHYWNGSGTERYSAADVNAALAVVDGDDGRP